MGWPWRRRVAPVPVVASRELVPAPRLERLLVACARQTQYLDGRLDQLERRLDDAVAAAQVGPTHADLLEVRLHSARVAAELARVAVELRGEIERMATRAPGAPGGSPMAHDSRVLMLAEQILDLSDSIDTLPGDLRDAGPGGWAATA